ncbi:hypothetical protein ACR3LR_01875 [Pantoea eucalypti]|uniref:hypothetical protein n=1 Tax=Pantoea eucalypti TaxID=470933 RepID=UPI003EE438F6
MGSSTLLPLDYKNYEGKDAATVVAINPKGFVGTFYLSVYEKKGSCYDRTERYQLESNLIPSAGHVMTGKVKPGRLMTLQQLNTIKSDYDEKGKKLSIRKRIYSLNGCHLFRSQENTTLLILNMVSGKFRLIMSSRLIQIVPKLLLIL